MREKINKTEKEELKMNDVKIVEIREFLEDSDLQYNFYEVVKLLRKLENELHFILSMNKDDYDYMNTIISKMKTNLEKVNCILEFQKK